MNFSKVRKPHLSPEAQIAHTSRAESYGNGQTFRTKGEAHLPNHTFAFPGLDKSFSFSCKMVCLFARLSCALAYLKPILKETHSRKHQHCLFAVVPKSSPSPTAKTLRRALVSSHITVCPIISLFRGLTSPPHYLTVFSAQHLCPLSVTWPLKTPSVPTDLFYLLPHLPLLPQTTRPLGFAPVTLISQNCQEVVSPCQVFRFLRRTFQTTWTLMFHTLFYDIISASVGNQCLVDGDHLFKLKPCLLFWQLYL